MSVDQGHDRRFPLLVVEGRWSSRDAHAFLAMAPLVAVLVAFVALGVYAWLRHMGYVLAWWIPGPYGAVVPAVVVWLVFQAYVDARAGVVEFFEEHLVVTKPSYGARKGDRVQVILFSDLAGFDDGSKDFIRSARSFLLVRPVAWLAGAFFVVVVAAASAWTFKYAPTLLVLVFCGAIVVATTAALALRHFGLSRTARVLFYEDRILVLKPGEDCDRGTKVAWTDLAGYDDGSADYVRLRTRGALGGFRSLRLSVPTPAEEDRVAVLALLDRRGVPRLA